MKFDVPWIFLSASLAYFLALFISFFEDHNRRCHLRKVEKLGEILEKVLSLRLTMFPYMELVSKY